MDRIPVYFVPGLASKTSIYEYIKLPEDQYESIFLDWEIPLPAESLTDYVTRFRKRIQHENPVLIGVSFGGIIVQEMAKIIAVRRLIIISSVKSNREYPKKFRIAKLTAVYKWFPIAVLINLPRLTKFKISPKIDERLRLYKRYLGVTDKYYWNWSLKQIMCWERETADPQVIHIHGTKDEVFPAQYIQNYIPILGGTHIMLITRYKWFNENLPNIIRFGKPS